MKEAKVGDVLLVIKDNFYQELLNRPLRVVRVDAPDDFWVESVDGSIFTHTAFQTRCNQTQMHFIGWSDRMKIDPFLTACKEAISDAV